MRRYFERAHAASGLDFVPGRLEHSFRSGESILAAVDHGLQPTSPAASHRTGTAFRRISPCPMRRPAWWKSGSRSNRTSARRSKAGTRRSTRSSETSPRVKLAQRIARTVRQLIDAREPVGIERRAARYGDVLILVRQRGELFEAIIRALKNEKVEVAGADRLVLTEHIAVMDLIALADALLLPEDDLALATVLRSPLFGFSDEDLFAIAWDRGRLSLRAALTRKSGESHIFAAADGAPRQAGARRAAQDAVCVLCADPRRRRRAAAFPGAARPRKPTTRSTNSSISRSTTSGARRRRCKASSPGCAQARAEVKRDMEIARDEVRVMTVHGAKGLEAPIVILADTMTPPAGPRHAAAPDAWRHGDDLGGTQGGRCAARSRPRGKTRLPRPSTNIAGCSMWR